MRAWAFLPLFGAALPGQQPSKLPLPDETVGFDSVVKTLVSAFDHVDIVALGEDHSRKVDSDLRIAIVRHPDFAKKVRFIVVEFGSSAQQSTLDRYIRGEDVPLAELQQVWKSTTQGDIWDSPVYADFYAAVREVVKKLPGRRPNPRAFMERDISFAKTAVTRFLASPSCWRPAILVGPSW